MNEMKRKDKGPHSSKNDTPGLCNLKLTVSLPAISNIRFKPKTTKIIKRKDSSENWTYNYEILKGNNSRVLLTTLRRRPWWRSSNGNHVNSHLVWEMYKSSKRFDGNNTSQKQEILINHLENNNCLVSKKGLFKSINEYCIENNIEATEIIPKTFYLRSNNLTFDNDYQEFIHYNSNQINVNILSDDTIHTPESDSAEDQNVALNRRSGQDKTLDNEGLIWIVKPASTTNRGVGIKVLRGQKNVLEFLQCDLQPNSKHIQKKSKQIVAGSDNINEPSDESPSVSEESECQEDNAGGSDVSQMRKKDPKKPSSRANSRGMRQGWIVQEYMLRPLLVSGRKFDLRCFVLLTLSPPTPSRQRRRRDSTSLILKGFFFRHAYARTSSRKFQLKDLRDRQIHLTNDAVQKGAQSYGKFESGNKLNLEELQAVITRDYPEAPPNVVMNHIMPQIRRLCRLSIEAGIAQGRLGESSVRSTFELLGYDFMVDDSFRSVLIEVNSNPCLEFACPLLTEIITDVIEHTFRVAVDSIYPPPPPSQRTKASEEAVDVLHSTDCLFDMIYP